MGHPGSSLVGSFLVIAGSQNITTLGPTSFTIPPYNTLSVTVTPGTAGTTGTPGSPGGPGSPGQDNGPPDESVWLLDSAATAGSPGSPGQAAAPGNPGSPSSFNGAGSATYVRGDPSAPKVAATVTVIVGARGEGSNGGPGGAGGGGGFGARYVRAVDENSVIYFSWPNGNPGGTGGSGSPGNPGNHGSVTVSWS